MNNHRLAYWAILAGMVTWSSASEAAPEPAGRVVQVAGAPRAGKRALKEGDPIYESDAVDCPKGASAKLLMKDSTILDVNSESRVEIASFRGNGADRQVELSVGGAGKLRASVNQHLGNGGKFIIRTKTATMGVRGTEFVVGAGASTQLTVLQGNVEVSGSGAKAGAAPILVGAGSQLIAAVGAPPVMSQLSADQLRAVSASAKIKDNTFSQAVTIDSSKGKSSAGASAAGSVAEAVGAKAKELSQASANAQMPLDARSQLDVADAQDMMDITWQMGLPVKVKINFKP